MIWQPLKPISKLMRALLQKVKANRDGLRGLTPLALGDNVLLARPRARDFKVWLNLRHESRDALQRREPSWPHDHLTKRGYTRYLREYSLARRYDTGCAFFIWDREQAHLMGACHINQIRRGAAQMATLGYWMGAPFQNCGYMTEAVSLVCDYAFSVLGLHRLEAACMVDNIASYRVLENNQFRHEGRANNYLKLDGCWEDHFLYGLSCEDLER